MISVGSDGRALIGRLLVVALLSVPVAAQKNPRPGRAGGEAWHAQRAQPRAPQPPPRWLQRLQNMSPEEQERFLRNNRRFLSLPPEQQARIRQRLEQWNRLTPQQRQELRRRAQIWQSLTPEERRQVREQMLPRWRALPPERRRLLLGRLRQLQQVPPAQREQLLHDPAFLAGLSADEQQLLVQLAHLRVQPHP